MILENINFKYNDKIIYENFNIVFEDNKINCIIGKSGCGKTTLLNYISNILISNKANLSYVFQSDNLIPWKSVYSNLKIVAKKYFTKEFLNDEIDRVLKLVGLFDFKSYYPRELSGGMRQRVNFARALIGSPDIILMDEPFKSLDIKCKNEMMNIIKKLSSDKCITIILVTHDKDEIINLAHCVYLLGESPVRILEEFKEKDIQKNIQKII
ncbi:ATP-binding cassette domain-containing protein [Clostridioides difficile]